MGPWATLVFVAILALELAVAVMGTGLAAAFLWVMWDRSPWQGLLAILMFVGVFVGLVRAWRSERLSTADTGVHRGPSLSRIPIAGSMGAVYMLQFAIWAVVTPAVGLLYAVLIGGGVLLLPLVYWANRRSRRQATHVAVGGVIGVVSALLVVSAVSSREMPLASLFGLAVVSGLIGAVVLIWRRRTDHPTIARQDE